jgi:hypothetical protein
MIAIFKNTYSKIPIGIFAAVSPAGEKSAVSYSFKKS